MSFLEVRPSAEDAEAALRFVFDAWASLPPSGPREHIDPADLALLNAYSEWRAAKEASRRNP